MRERFVYVFIVEELCHIIWAIDDEWKVRDKVYEVIKRIYHDIRFDDLFNPNWDGKD